MTTIPPPMFSFPLSGEAALVPRTPLLTDAYHALLAANHERLARWEPWAVNQPVLEETAPTSKRARATGSTARNCPWRSQSATTSNGAWPGR